MKNTLYILATLSTFLAFGAAAIPAAAALTYSATDAAATLGIAAGCFAALTIIFFRNAVISQ